MVNGMCSLWEEPAESAVTGLGDKASEAQRIARDLKVIQEALGQDDVREALKVVDGQLPLAPDAKARRCLPKLFPRSSQQPSKPNVDPNPEDTERFLTELRSAYKFAPRNRGGGPGGTAGEHQS